MHFVICTLKSYHFDNKHEHHCDRAKQPRLGEMIREKCDKTADII